ncbi:MAG TPA: Gfo/Idh/MocA family oxidoreductase [Bacteroidales bacterium]|jgi:predicted dehydrogenase|nr:Gfo/Idh/MocA family oxidoreductase [Bacteroidales bacterium]
MRDKIKWGVIGSGGIAKRRTIPEGIIPSGNGELAIVYDVNAEANAAVAKQFNAKAVGSVAELLKSDVDAVYVASPVNMHFEQVLACASASKHVLCEKPLGMTVAEAKKMISSCSDANVLLGVGLMMRFNTRHKEAKKMIDKGMLGKPVYARAQLSCWYPPIEGAWRQDPAKGGGGSLMDMGSHCLDLLEMFFGKAKQVSCFTASNVHDYKSEDSAVVSVMFENGAMGSVDTYFCIPDDSSKNILELYGSNGSIIAKGTIGQGADGEMTAYLQNVTGSYNAEQSRSNGNGMNVSPEPVNTYRAEIEEFGNAILENREPLNSFVHGLRSLEVLEACYKSARTGKVIHL